MLSALQSANVVAVGASPALLQQMHGRAVSFLYFLGIFRVSTRFARLDLISYNNDTRNDHSPASILSPPQLKATKLESRL